MDYKKFLTTTQTLHQVKDISMQTKKVGYKLEDKYWETKFKSDIDVSSFKYN
jgi:hypothetical protein